MDPLTLAFTTAGTLISGAGLILQALPYFFAKSKYEALRSALSGIEFDADDFPESRTLKIDKPQLLPSDEKKQERLIRYLDISEVMLPLVRQRALTRITIVAIATLLAFMMIPFNFHGPAVFAGHSSFEWQDVMILIGGVLAPHIAFVRSRLGAEEIFFKNLQNLHEEFYRTEVAPRLSRFNYDVTRLFPGLPDVSKQYLDLLQRQVDSLQEVVNKRLPPTKEEEEQKKLVAEHKDESDQSAFIKNVLS